MNGPITTAQIKKGLYSLHGATLGGLTPPLTFTKGSPTPIDCWFWVGISHGKFTTPYGLKPVCAKPVPTHSRDGVPLWDARSRDERRREHGEVGEAPVGVALGAAIRQRAQEDPNRPAVTSSGPNGVIVLAYSRRTRAKNRPSGPGLPGARGRVRGSRHHRLAEHHRVH